MTKVIINADGAIYGRLCSFAAKEAISGKEVIVVNSEKAVITGNKANVIGNYIQARQRGGHSQKGPKISKMTSRLLRRGIRGMIPNHREGFGREIFKKILCYDGVPKEYEGHKMVEIKKPIHNKYIKLEELSKKL